MPLGNEFGLYYRDARGNETDRVVSVREIYEGKNGIAIDAHCHVRDSRRTFLSHRIRALYEPDSGEVIEDVESTLRNHSLFNPNRLPPQQDWKMPASLNAQLETLGYLASYTDGRAKQKAKLITDYVTRFWQVPSNKVDDLLDFVYRLDSEEAEIYEGLGDISDSDEEQVRAFIETCLEIIHLDDRVTYDEEDFLLDLEDALREGGHDVKFTLSDDQEEADSEAVPGDYTEKNETEKPSQLTTWIVVGIVVFVVIAAIF